MALREPRLSGAALAVKATDRIDLMSVRFVVASACLAAEIQSLTADLALNTTLGDLERDAAHRTIGLLSLLGIWLQNETLAGT